MDVLMHRLETQRDVSVDAALRVAYARSVKGGMKGVPPLIKQLLESFKARWQLHLGRCLSDTAPSACAVHVLVLY